MKRYCYFNGKIMPIERAKINPYDLGILRGYCVFDVMCTQNGKPFLLEEHWRRFLNSANELKLIIPITIKKYEEVVRKLIKFNGFRESTIRTILSGGISSDGFSLENGRETFYILVEKFKKLPDEYYKKGAKVIAVDYSRDFPKAKIANYVLAIKSQERKRRAEALEIIYVSGGKALEASTSNLFIVSKGAIVTPKKSVLLGTTRNLIVKLARKNGFKVKERDVSETELYSADEAFISATNKDIVPVVSVNGRKIGNRKVGEITKRLMKIFEEFIRKY